MAQQENDVAQPLPMARRVDVPPDLRRQAAGVAARGTRIASVLGRQWTTPTGFDEAAEHLLRLVEEALVLRRLLVAEQAKGGAR